MKHEVGLDDHISLAVFSFLRCGSNKTPSKEPDSLGDKISRAILKYTYLLGSTGLTCQWLEETIKLLNQFEKEDVERRNTKAGFDVVRYIPWVINNS